MSQQTACNIFRKLLETCDIDLAEIKGTRKVWKGKKPKRAKRALSGYNCFTKNMYSEEKRVAKKEEREPLSFSKFLKMKTWGTLADRQKRVWNDLAEQGCPDIIPTETPEARIRTVPRPSKGD